ncbi:hypothetical protein HBH72_182660 [Parastagonospora nodorum]|nr:hypothetical protein HBH72_182660 [Parastagonospora nodorum]
MLAKVRQYSAKVKTEDLSNMPTLILVASLTKPAILNNANIALVDAVHYSVVKQFSIFRLITKESQQKLEKNYFKVRAQHLKYDALIQHLSLPKYSDYSYHPRREADIPNLYQTDLPLSANERQSLCKSRDSNRILHSRRLTDAYILYFKELSSNNSGIFANAIGIGKTQAIVLAVLIGHCNPSDLLALQFCFFSNSPPENIGRPTKEEAIEMRINTTNAISKALAAANKLIILEANTPAMHPKATKHYPAPSAAQFMIVCSFRKVDKHVFRAYNTISVTAQRTIIRKGSPYIEKRFNATNKRDSVTSDRIYKIEDARNIIANVKHDASEHKSSHNIKGNFLPYFQSCLCLDFLSIVQNAKQQYRDILEKEGLNKSEASRHIIFNRFKMQAIASYPALATLKAAQFKTYSSRKVKRFTSNSVKDLFTNLSKDYFLVREARAITKSSLKFQNLSNLCSKLGLREKFSNKSVLVMQRGITQHEINLKLLAEIYVSIVYFNPDSKLELKVLGKQDVKTTSQDKLQGRGSTVTDQRID